jgi:surface polysaccharide O-acyltransferase-like enzyme
MAAVVLIHAMSSMVTNDAVRGSGRWWVAQVLDSGSSWSVPVFLMVSGALVLAPVAGRSAGDFYRRRLHRIAIPLLVAHVVYFAVRAFALHQSLTPGVVVRDLLQVKVAAHLYFFWIIAGLYVIAPLITAFIVTQTRRAVLWLGIVAMTWMLVVTWSSAVLRAVHTTSTPWVPPMLTLFLPYIGYFVLGYALRDVRLRRPWLIACAALFVLGEVLHIVLTAGGFRGVIPAAMLGGGYQGLPVAVAAVTLFLIGRTLISPRSVLARPPMSRVARRLGDLTLGVFIFHLVVMLAVNRTILSGWHPESVLGDALLRYVVVLIASFALCWLISKVPILRRSIGL